MRLALFLLVAAGLAFAADAPKPDAKDAEIAALKAQVVALHVELQVANLPEVMRTRLAVIEAQAAFVENEVCCRYSDIHLHRMCQCNFDDGLFKFFSSGINSPFLAHTERTGNHMPLFRPPAPNPALALVSGYYTFQVEAHDNESGKEDVQTGVMYLDGKGNLQFIGLGAQDPEVGPNTGMDVTFNPDLLMGTLTVRQHLIASRLPKGFPTFWGFIASPDYKTLTISSAQTNDPPMKGTATKFRPVD